jgi:FKBP-type peptidyl-prolyl cis-trans isomerase
VPWANRQQRSSPFDEGYIYANQKEPIVKRTKLIIALSALALTAWTQAVPAEANAPAAAPNANAPAAAPNTAAPAAPAAPGAPAAQPAPAAPEVDLGKVSQVIGNDIGKNISRRFDELGVQLDKAALVQAFSDAVNGKPSAISDEETQKLMTDFSQFVRAAQAKAGEKNLAAGEAFLAENGKKEGIKTTASGLQYKVIKEGTGKTPTATDRVQVDYAGTLIDGKEFDSSIKRGEPAEFPVGGVIPGWTEALQLMKEGGKMQIFVPASLAYGPRSQPGIPANSVLIFDVELKKILPKEEPQGVEIPAQPQEQPGAPKPQ